MKDLYNLREMLCEELDKIARKTSMSSGDLDTAHKLTDTIKNIDKIEMLEDTGYSQAGDWTADMRGTYGRGSSYRTRDAKGRYSRTDAHENMRRQLEDLWRDADDERTRDAIRRCMDTLEK